MINIRTPLSDLQTPQSTILLRIQTESGENLRAQNEKVWRERIPLAKSSRRCDFSLRCSIDEERVRYRSDTFHNPNYPNFTKA